MSALNFPQFLKRYNIALLYVSDDQIMPAALLKKERQGYDYQGHLKDFLDGGANRWTVKKSPASIVYGSVEREVSLSGSASVNDLGLKISGGLGKVRSISYTLHDVRVEVPSNTDPIHLVSDINALRKSDRNAWKKINGLWVVEKTFHVAAFDVKINVDGNADWEAELKDSIDVGTDGKVKWTGKKEFTVTNSDAVPFGFTGFKI